MLNTINRLLAQANELRQMGEVELSEGFRDIARRILDDIAWRQELRARSAAMSSNKKKDISPKDELRRQAPVVSQGELL